MNSTPRCATTDRRRHARALFGHPVAVQSNGETRIARLQEISEGGLRVADTWLAPGSSVSVTVPLRGRFGRVDYCALAGQVVREGETGMAVAFGRLLPRHLLQLRSYVWSMTSSSTMV